MLLPLPRNGGTNSRSDRSRACAVPCRESPHPSGDRNSPGEQHPQASHRTTPSERVQPSRASKRPDAVLWNPTVNSSRAGPKWHKHMTKCLLARGCINASRHIVEVGGIEPPSSRDEPGLLRAQLTSRSAWPLRSRQHVAARPSPIEVLSAPPDEELRASLSR